MSIAKLEALDSMAFVRNRLREAAVINDEWSGIPLPLEGQRLVIEPSYKFAGLGDIGKAEPAEGPAPKIRNIFWSHYKNCRMAICEEPEGEFWIAPLMGSANTATALLNTLGASDAWGIEQEHNAIQLLGSLVRHRRLRQYMLTGTFLETSKRSGVVYLFRRLKPTVAMSGRTGSMRILCAMCMHPIGYYEESWAGSMCPTDDVIAHLMLMRGDEKMFWRRCNQHAPWDKASGL